MKRFDLKNMRSTVAVAILLVSLDVTLVLSLQNYALVQNSGAIFYPPAPQVLFTDDFETGDFTNWNGTLKTAGDNASVSAVTSYEGSFGARFETDTIPSGTRYAYCYFSVPAGVTEVYARGYFMISEGLPLNSTNDLFGLVALEVGGQLQCAFQVYRSAGVDRFNIMGFNGSSIVSQSTNAIYPVEARWFSVEVYMKVHSTDGQYRVWIDGVQQIAVTGIDTTKYGLEVTRVRFGLTSVVNVQKNARVYCDTVVVSTEYVGQSRYKFGVVGSVSTTPALNNFIYLFENQSISYRIMDPSDVARLEDIDRFDGLVLWTRQCSGYNASAIQEFAKTHVTISDVKDFCNAVYSSLSGSMQVVSTSSVTYAMNWGNFRAGDLVEMRNETGNVNQLTAVQASALAAFANVTTVARYDASRTVSFYMHGTQANAGFFVMDLDATTPETEWTGIWHVFPAVKQVQDFPTGQYARWMGNGQSWFNLSWVYSMIDAIVNANGDIASRGVIGKSVAERDILAIAIGTGSKYAIVDGAIHGNEKTGTFACLRLAELLIEYYRSDSFWRSKLTEYTVIVIPVLNPDGFMSNTRENANGVDLNSQFPPDGTPTEPEAFALINLMGNYTPTAYINLHEGYNWYPLDMLYGNYEFGTNRTLTVNAMGQANATFVGLKHYGRFTEQNCSVWIGGVRAIYGGGKLGMAVSYASYLYKTSCMLAETYVWSQSYGARHCLWGLDYYPSVILSFLKNLQR